MGADSSQVDTVVNTLEEVDEKYSVEVEQNLVKFQNNNENQAMNKLHDLKQRLSTVNDVNRSSKDANVLLKPHMSGQGTSRYDTFKRSHTRELHEEINNIKPMEHQTNDEQIKKVIETLPKSNRVHNIKSVFVYKKTLGKGKSCRVLLCKHQENNKMYALKQMNIEQRHNPILFLTEANILKSLQKCKNIITFFDAYMDRKHMYIATDYLSGGTLLSHIHENTRFTEQIAVEAIKTILNTVKFIHSKKIYHRDLKPNNLVYDKAGPDGVLSMIDFGEATMVGDKEYDNKYVGTLPFFTPEMIRSSVRTGVMIRKADMWCIGVISFILLTGTYPFMADSNKGIKKSIIGDPLEWPKHVDLSDECKDLIGKLLNKKWKQRLSADKALKHEWICNEKKARDVDLGKQFHNYIVEFQNVNKLEHIILHAITSKMSGDECHFLVDELLKFNHNQDKLNEKNLLEFLILHKVNAETAKRQCKNIFDLACSDDSKEHEIDLHNEHLLSGVFNEICKDKEFIKIGALELDGLHEMLSDGKDDHHDQIIDRRESVISVNQFRILVKDVSVKYNMEQVINNLDPKATGFVDLKSLCHYSQAISSLSPVSVDTKHEPTYL